MDRQTLDEMIDCRPPGRLRYWYFRDRYALTLLGLAAGEGLPVATLKRSALAGLLQKPRVKQLLAAGISGRVGAGVAKTHHPGISHCRWHWL